MTLTGPARTHVEQHGALQARHAWITIALVLSIAGNFAAFAVIGRLAARPTHLPPVVLRDPAGRAYLTSLDGVQYQPTEADIRGAIATFFELRLSRVRSVIERDLPRSLYFMDQKLITAESRDHLRTDAIAKWFKSPVEDELVVTAPTVSLDPVTDPRRRSALVDYEVRHISPQHQVTKTDAYTARVQFDLAPNNDPEMRKINVPGVQITAYDPVPAFTN